MFIILCVFVVCFLYSLFLTSELPKTFVRRVFISLILSCLVVLIISLIMFIL